MSANNQVIATECPICMDTIEGLCNRVVTECGHAFHCSCLMQNAAHNGFGCPYCRTTMAEQPEEEDEDDGYSIEEATVFDEDVLTSFRMLHQRINGEEVEEEADEWESIAEGEESEEEEEEGEEDELPAEPDAAYVAQKLAERGITIEDLVKDILYQEHSNYGNLYSDYERRSSEVFGQFRAVISQYRPTYQVAPLLLSLRQHPPVAPPLVTQVAPAIAESKSVVVPRRREFMVHI